MRTGLMAAVVGLAGSLAMGSGVSAGSDTNAALEYYRAWSMLGDSRDQVIDTGGDKIVLSDGAEDTLNKVEDAISMLVHASSMHDADWGVDFEDGPNTLIPHLGSMRHSARLMAAAALMHAEEGELDRAAACVAALHRIGVHSASGDTLIGSLVGIAIGNLGAELTDQMIDDGMISRDGARVILDAIQTDGTSDRYRMRDAILGEWRMIAEFLLSKAPERDAGKWLLETMQMDVDDDVTRAIAGMEKSAMMREMGGWSAYYSDMLGAWDAGDRSRMNGVVERLKDGEYGKLTFVMAASLTRAFESTRQSEAGLDALIERLEEIAD